ncbi:hypothetical protein AMJ85_09390 [candidate division BRC1 bacterium SM23_51]|nr:MAG: hypothetical protein AMJ85_09390 [candidate division BRC1 bacterium SM23_51]
MRNHPKAMAFTLVEVLISLVIAVVMIVGILTLLNFNFVYQNQQELRANAMDVMFTEMEKLRRQFIFVVEPYAVLLSDNRTPDNPNDDTLGRLRLQLFDRDNNELTAAPTGHDRVRVVMTVTWRGRGRLSSRVFREQLVGHLIP